MATEILRIIIGIVVIEQDKDKVMEVEQHQFLLQKIEKNNKKIALYLARITTAVSHDLENGVIILVKH